MAEAFDAAVKDSGVDFGPEEAVVPVQPDSAEQPGTPATPHSAQGEQAGAEAPEHIRWFKSFGGTLESPESIDRALKQAYEVNKHNERVSREIAELRTLQQRQQELAPRKDDKPVAAEEPREKSEIEILEEIIDARVEAKTKAQAEVLAQVEERYVNDACLTAKRDLQKFYGTTVVPDGKGGQQEVPIYDLILPEIGNAVQGYLQANNIDSKVFFKEMVRRGTLIPTFQSLANAILMPRLQQALNGKQQTQAKAEADQAKQQAELDRQKAAVLPKRGSPAGEVTKTRVVNSIHDAARLAEEELGYKLAD
jgi:hypothetical protein